MVINALNSGARGFMADFEDANSPTWGNMVGGQATSSTRSSARSSSRARTGATTASTTRWRRCSFARAAGICRRSTSSWTAKPISGSLFDFGLFFFHNAQRLLDKGSGPYFYLPKLESHLEARLWNDVFLMRRNGSGCRAARSRRPCSIETIPAAFEMDEILYELREHSAG